MGEREQRRPCRVCAEKSDGAHFGVESCRACAAFFRRSIVMRKKYVCRAGGHACVINKSVRCMCRACRFRKCIRAGMSRVPAPNARDNVSSDLIDVAEAASDARFLAYYTENLEDATSPGEADIPPRLRAPASPALPTLARLAHGYSVLRTKRTSYRVDVNMAYEPLVESYMGDGFDGHFENAFENKGFCDTDVPSYHTFANNDNSHSRAISMQHADRLLVIDYPNIIEFVSTALPRLDELPNCQKFLFMDSAAHTMEVFPRCTDRLVVSDGNYIDIANLTKFFDGDTQMSADEAESSFRPSFNIFVNALLRPMQALRPSEMEIVALLALTVYQIGLDGESDATNALCRSMQDQIFRELTQHYAQQPGITEPAVRLGQLLSLFPGLQRVVERHWEDLLISKIFASSFNQMLYKIFRSP